MDGMKQDGQLSLAAYPCLTGASHAQPNPTAMPGEVISYDADTRRANVRGSIQLLMVDGTTVDRPVIVNAPVVFPMSATFAITWPLHAGDPVLLVFSA